MRALQGFTFCLLIAISLGIAHTQSVLIQEPKGEITHEIQAAAACELPQDWRSGGKVIYTTEMIDGLMNERLIPEWVNSMLEIEIADIDGSTKTSSGAINYHIGDIVITQANLLGASFTADTTENILSELVDIGMIIEFNYHYKKTSWPYTDDEGVGKIIFESLSVTLNIQTDNDLDGGLVVEIISAPTVIDGFSIDLDSPLSWLYDAIFAIIDDRLIETMEKNVESVIIAGANEAAAYLKGWFQPCYQVVDHIQYDQRVLSNGFEVGNGYLWMGFSFLSTIAPNSECNCEYFDNSSWQEDTLPDIVTDNMWQSLTSKHVVSQLFENYRLDGLFDASFSAQTSPDNADLLTGEYWINLYPDLASKVSPADPLVLDITAPNSVDFDIYPAACLADLLLHGSLRNPSTNEEILTFDAHMSFTLQPESNHPRNIRLIFFTECDDAQVMESSLVPADKNTLYDAVLDIQERLVYPVYSNVFITPSFYITSITAAYPEAEYVDGHWSMGTDHGGYIMWSCDLKWNM